MRSIGEPIPLRSDSSRSSGSFSCGTDCHTRSCGIEPLPQAGCAEPAVLVVDAGDAAGVRELHAGAHRVEVLVVGKRQVPFLEPPRGLFAQHAGRLAARVAFDHAALDVEVAAGKRERGRVEPERVVVLRPQRRRLVCDRVERLPRRRAVGPVRVAPAVAAAPPARADPLERFRERAAAVELRLRCASAHVGKCTCESVKAGRTQRPPRSTISGDASAVSCVADAAGDAVARDRERPCERQRRVERADDAVLEDHPASCSIMSVST